MQLDLGNASCDVDTILLPNPDSAAAELTSAGLVERVTYHNAENGFCVLRAKARGHREEQPTKFDLTINLGTANALGLTIPLATAKWAQ